MPKELQDSGRHDEFQAWRRSNPSGVFLACKTSTNANLHGSQCQHLGDMTWSTNDWGQSLTKMRKVSGESEASLYAWAKERGIEVHRCNHCIRDGYISLTPSLEKQDQEPRTLQSVESALASEVAASLTLSAKERQARLRNAPVQPQQLEITAMVFLRNPDVVAEVLRRANGRCESCKSGAPFRRCSDGSPYLEVHHRIRLADGGDDAVENALALCPNCHRKAHYG